MNDSLNPALISVESLEIATDDSLGGRLPAHVPRSKSDVSDRWAAREWRPGFLRVLGVVEGVAAHGRQGAGAQRHALPQLAQRRRLHRQVFLTPATRGRKKVCSLRVSGAGPSRLLSAKEQAYCLGRGSRLSCGGMLAAAS